MFIAYALVDVLRYIHNSLDNLNKHQNASVSDERSSTDLCLSRTLKDIDITAVDNTTGINLVPMTFDNNYQYPLQKSVDNIVNPEQNQSACSDIPNSDMPSISPPQTSNAECIELWKYSESINTDDAETSKLRKHHFCQIPLEVDIFCDLCNCPIFTKSFQPVCLKCSDCHFTCHTHCKGDVQVRCQGSLRIRRSPIEQSDPTPFHPQEAVSTTDVKPIESACLSNELDNLLISNDPKTPRGAHTIDRLGVPQPNGTHGADYGDFTADKITHSSLLNKTSEKCLLTTNKLVRHESRKDRPPGADGDTAASECSLFDGDLTTSTDDEQDLLNQTTYYTAIGDLDYAKNLSIPPFTAFPTPKPPIPRLVNKPASRTGITRRGTDIGAGGSRRRTNLTSRHSFLAGHGSNATVHSRLFYDFSSLDREAIKSHGIRVHELSSAAVTGHAALQTLSAPVPPERISSLSPQPSTSSSSTRTGSEFGVASIQQSTTVAIQQKIRRTRCTMFEKAPAAPLTQVLVGPRDQLPYDEAELKNRLEVFNSNEFGLHAQPASNQPSGDCEGQVRIHINLLRPIRMRLSARPVSIFDLVGAKQDDIRAEVDEMGTEAETDETHGPQQWDQAPKTSHATTDKPCSPAAPLGVHFNQPKSAVTAQSAAFSANSHAPPVVASGGGVNLRASSRPPTRQPCLSTFWLPRGSTKVLYVHMSTTAHKVITALLHRFYIEDNPQKFALYEHTIEGDQDVSVRKLFDNESPLGLLMRWTEDGPDRFNEMLSLKRLVLQENETGDIEWTGFSLPELNTFLNILSHEEADYRRRIEMKNELRRKEVLRLMSRYETSFASTSSSSSVDPSSENSAPTLPCRAPEETEHPESCIPPELNISPNFDSVPASSLLPDRSEMNGGASATPRDNRLLRLPSASVRGTNDLEALSACTTPNHSPERNQAVQISSTLPRLFGTGTGAEASRSRLTMFKLSPYRQMKKAEKAQQKREAKLERERAKDEKKRLKALEKPESQSRKFALFLNPHNANSSTNGK